MLQEMNSVEKKVYTPIKLSSLGDIADLTQMGYLGKRSGLRRKKGGKRRRKKRGQWWKNRES